MNVARQGVDFAPGDAPAYDGGMETIPFRDKVRSALIWRSGAQIAAQTIQWGITIIVIRLLHPADYGLAAMTETVTAFLTILAAQGFSNALVQMPDLSERQIRQSFGLLLLINAVLAAFQWTIAGLAATWFRQPLVADLLRVLAFAYLILPFVSVPMALASRRMDFRSPALVHFWSAIIAGACVLAVAAQGYGVWALITGSLVLPMSRAIGMLILTRWLVRPDFRFDGMEPIIRFGLRVMGNAILWFFYAAADIFIAGRQLPAYDVGVYTESLFLATLPVTKFLPALNEVGFTAFARIQHDRDAVASHFLKSVRLVTLLFFPVFFGLASVAGLFVPVVMGPQWIESVPVIQLLCLAMPFHAINNLLPGPVNALGQPHIQTRAVLTGMVIMPVAFLVGVRFGPVGLAGAWACGLPLLVALTAPSFLRVIGARAGQVAGACLPALCGSALMSGGIWLATTFTGGWQPALALLALILAGAALYAGAISLLFPAARAELLALARK